MFLVAADPRLSGPEEKLELVPHEHRWRDAPVSLLAHHDGSCCELAREWVRCMDFAQLNGAGLLSGPRWLRERYQWGPSRWPLHWCEAIEADTIDCGAHAALANEVFEARGVTCYRAQFIQDYDARTVEQWRTIWSKEDVAATWLGDRSIYHEGNAILCGDRVVKLWDGSASSWINPVQSGGYGSLRAVRISSLGKTASEQVEWGKRLIGIDQWHYFG